MKFCVLENAMPVEAIVLETAFGVIVLEMASQLARIRMLML